MQTAAATSVTIGEGLTDRVLRAFGVLAIYWLLSRLPLPGLDQSALTALYALPGDTSVPRASIVMLGLAPMLSVLVVYEFAKILWPSIAKWRAAAPENAARIDIALATATLILAFLQGLGLAAAFENLHYAVDPGWGFRLIFAAALVVGTALLIALMYAAARWGLGDGFWLVYAAPFVGALAGSLYVAASAGELNSASPPLLAAAGLVAATVVVMIFSIKTEPALAAPGALAWPPYLAVYAIAVALIPVIKLLPGTVANALVEAMSFGTVWRSVLVALLIPAFLILRQTEGASARQAAWRLAPAAIALAALVIAGEWLNVHVGVAFKLDVPTVLAIGAAVLAVLRLKQRA